MKHFISLGAGVQSSTMALMAAHGELEPMPEAAIFADTQAEPASVYRWLDWLEKELPFPVHRVTAGPLRERALKLHTSAKGRVFYDIEIPLYTQSPGKESGQIRRRECSREYKLKPIERTVRRLAEVRPREKSPRAIVWLGISTDEFQRMKESSRPFIRNRWPLIELRMSRASCLAWMEAKGYPEPPRSACVFCPFRSNAEWRHLAKTDPEGFADAKDFDIELREKRPGDTEAFLHRSMMPLGEVDIRNDVDKGQLLLWQDECTGLCGV